MVGKQARKVRDLLKEGRNGFIVSHKEDSDFEGLNGLGIYAPAVTSGADLTRLELHPGDYRKLALSQETGYHGAISSTGTCETCWNR